MGQNGPTKGNLVKTQHLSDPLNQMTLFASNAAKKIILKQIATLPRSRGRTKSRTKAV